MIERRKRMLSEFLNENTIRTDVDAKTWREAAQAAGKLLLDQGYIQDEIIGSMIETVEEHGPYVIIVPEIAFFHGRPGPGVKQVCMILITLRNTVYFSEFKNQPIKAAFAFAALDTESHRQVLMSVGKILQNKDFLPLLRCNGNRQEIEKIIQQY